MGAENETNDGLGDLDMSGVGDIAGIYESEIARLFGLDDITPEINDILIRLDMDKVAKAGGIAEHLRELIKEKRAELETVIKDVSSKYGQTHINVDKITHETEQAILKSYLDALTFVVENTHHQN